MFDPPKNGVLNCRSDLARREGPSTLHKLVDWIPCKTKGRATPVKIIGKNKESGWFLISDNGKEAWSSDKYIEVNDASERENEEEDSESETVKNDLEKAINEAERLNEKPPKKDCKGEAQSGPIIEQEQEQGPDSNCTAYPNDLYSSKNSGEDLVNQVKRAANKGVNNKVETFLELYSPMAIYLQEKTGWPASVTLAQMALETGWGTSILLRKDNNFGGLSCWKRDLNSVKVLKNPQLVKAVKSNDVKIIGAIIDDSEKVKIKNPCNFSRPEGYYYRSYESLNDAALLYLDNILESGSYKKSSDYVKGQFKAGVKADYNKVIEGLRPYAVASDYRKQLIGIIKRNNLEKYDNQKICQ